MKTNREVLKQLVALYMLAVFIGSVLAGTAIGLMGWVMQPNDLGLLYCLEKGWVFGCGFGMLLGIPFVIVMYE